MKRKLLGCMMFLAIFALGVGMFPEKINAIYRGSATDQSSSLAQKDSRNMARGYRGVRTRTATKSNGSFSSDMQKRSVRHTTGQRRSFSRKTVSTKNTILTHSFSADNVASFAIELPRDFKKTLDTLTWTDGKISFENESSKINIVALGNVCEGGTTFVQDCLDEKSDERTDVLEKEWISGIVLDKKIMPLRWTGEYRFDQENVGKWFLMDIGDKKIGVLTFFDPVRKYLWKMEIISDSSDGILNEAHYIDTMKESLFITEEEEGPSSRIKQRARGETRLRSDSTGRRSTTETFSSKDIMEYTAKQVPFEVEIPKGFTLYSDTLTRSSGNLFFLGEEGSIKITATDTLCVSQTSSITRKCIEKFGAEKISDLKELYPSMSNLGTKNYLLQLLKDSSRRFLGRGAILMSGLDRASTFVFAEPEYGHMWQMDIISNTGYRGVLGDTRQVRRVLNSLRFEKE